MDKQGADPDSTAVESESRDRQRLAAAKRALAVERPLADSDDSHWDQLADSAALAELARADSERVAVERAPAADSAWPERVAEQLAD